MTDSPKNRSGLLGIFYAIGPAIIVASVVLGPGSILASSRVGCEYGYQLIWMLVAAGILMATMVMLSAWIGVSYEKSFCTEIANRLGRPAAVLVGLIVFGIVACFQTSNNTAILFAFEPFFPDGQIPILIKVIVLLGVNLLLVAVLFGFKRIYRPLEKLMMILVLVMLIGFAVNFFFARASLTSILTGLLPTFPNRFFADGFFPYRTETAEGVSKIVVPFGGVIAMIATTFSVAGALYQSYLVKEKGWTLQQIRTGSIDSIFGIAVLVGISGLILCTSAAVLYGSVAPSDLKNAMSVANQLKPLFGNAAFVLFCVGIFAGAFSSFLVNAMIGGSVLADSLGKGDKVDSKWARFLTVAALGFGMIVALIATTVETSTSGIILFAQALTVIGNPGLAMAILYLAYQAKKDGKPIPGWLFFIGYIGLALVTVLAVQTGWKVILNLAG